VYADLCGWAATQTTSKAPLGFADPDAMGDAIKGALGNASIAGKDISFTHMHGMGAPNSDIPEAMAIVDVLGVDRTEALVLANHKANFGHSEYASGLVALVTTICSLNHNSVAQHLRVTKPLFEIVNAPMVLLPNEYAVQVGQCASVNGTSFSGNNVHLILLNGDCVRSVLPKLETPSRLDMHARMTCDEVSLEKAISNVGGTELHPKQPFMASGVSSAANSLTDASAISEAIIEMVSEIIGVDPPADESVMTLGLGSAGAMELSGRLSKKYGRRLPPTFVFKHPTIYSMVEFFTQVSTLATTSSAVPQLVNAEFKDEPRVGYKQWSGSLNRLDKPLYLLGSGGHSRTVIGQLNALDVPIAGIFTNLEKHVGTTLMGVKVLGLLEEVPAPTECFLHICLGQPLLKQEWAARFSTYSYVSIVHPMAMVEESCTMGEGSFIGALALVDGLVSIGAHSIVEGHSVVGHDTLIGSFTLIGGMAAIAGSCVIGDGVVLGTHSSTAPKVRLGNRAVLGSGSSAHSNIPEDCTAVGVPAEVLYEGVPIQM
jgi:acetyltransferase EpsM